MNEAKTIKTLDQLLKLDTSAVQTYDQALKTITDPAVREQIKELKSRHTDHADQLSNEILKLAHKMIATHWDNITSAAIEERQREAFKQKMRIVSGG